MSVPSEYSFSPEPTQPSSESYPLVWKPLELQEAEWQPLEAKLLSPNLAKTKNDLATFNAIALKQAGYYLLTGWLLKKPALLQKASLILKWLSNQGMSNSINSHDMLSLGFAVSQTLQGKVEIFEGLGLCNNALNESNDNAWIHAYSAFYLLQAAALPEAQKALEAAQKYNTPSSPVFSKALQALLPVAIPLIQLKQPISSRKQLFACGLATIRLHLAAFQLVCKPLMWQWLVWIGALTIKQSFFSPAINSQADALQTPHFTHTCDIATLNPDNKKSGNKRFSVSIAKLCVNALEAALHQALPFERTYSNTKTLSIHQDSNLQNKGETAEKELSMSQLDPKLYHRLSMAYLREGQVSPAIEALEQLIEQAPEEEQARHELIQLCRQTGQHFKALFHLKVLISEQPKEAKWHQLYGECLHEMQDLDGAIAEYQQALDCGLSKNKLVVIARKLATLYYTHKKDYQTSVTLLRYAAQIDPENPEILAQLAELYSEQGEFLAAVNLYRTLLHHYPNSTEIYSYLGYLLWQLDYNHEAKIAYEKALSIDNTNAVVHNNLGVLLLDNFNEIEEALLHFELALDQQHNYAMAAFNLGRVHQELGDLKSAQEAFCKALELNELSHELDPCEINNRLHDLFEV